MERQDIRAPPDDWIEQAQEREVNHRDGINWFGFPVELNSPYIKTVEANGGPRLNEHGARLTFLCRNKAIGCSAAFRYKGKLNQHERICPYTIFYRCGFQECKQKRENWFDSPLQLLVHACEKHGCVSDTEEDELITSNVTLSKEFLNPKENEWNLRFLRRCDLTVATSDVVMGLAIIVNFVSGEGSKISFVPVKLSGDGDINDHVIECLLEVRGADGIIIPNDQIGVGEDIQTRNIPGFNGTPTCLHACHSHQSYLDKTDPSQLPTYSKNLILRYGIRNGDNVKLSITTKIKATRCVIKREFVSVEQPFAATWETAGISSLVRSTMADAAEPIPSVMTKVVAPQVQTGKDLFLEALDEEAAVSAIVGSVLQQIIQTRDGVEQPLPRPAKVLVIMPTLQLIYHRFQNQWGQKALACNITTLEFRKPNRETIQVLKNAGGEIVVMTATVLADLMAFNDPKIWEMLTSQLKFFYLHHGDRFSWFEMSGTLGKFRTRLGPKVNDLTKITYSLYFPEDVREGLYVDLWRRGSVYVSVGTDPYQFIESMNARLFEPVTPEQKISNLINMIKGGRWLVLVHNTHDEDMKMLMRTLTLAEFQAGTTLTFCRSEALVRDNYNFFFPFLRNQNAILVGPYYLLDYDQVTNADGCVIYNPPHNWTDHVRVALAMRCNGGVFKTVYRFQKSYQ